ncbi:hypothetical protein GOODEAATRI_004214 [Goodea atripinnis]|uniref:Uncharacterized protein n=1 Tax=Goodea atripinnis TaxID=208336 RepID=A0ABV0MF06_9TELE
MSPRTPPLLHCLTNRVHAYLIGSSVKQLCREIHPRLQKKTKQNNPLRDRGTRTSSDPTFDPDVLKPTQGLTLIHPQRGGCQHVASLRPSVSRERERKKRNIQASRCVEMVKAHALPSATWALKG